ncbi:MAG: UDP-glucose 4-epimerase GalE [Nitrospinae bacterium]|nr:UDP-glucose 4-epimerase GalE [Nitrospinota bacterium]
MTVKGTVLVTGGAGYIGSHCALYLRENGWETVILDNLSTGHKESALGQRLVVGDVGDGALLDSVFKTRSISAVMHFAASAYVGESVTDPAKYYRNNVVNGLALLDAMRRNGVSNLVFSSTCAVYGNPERTPLTETHPKAPISPYGFSKLAFERMAEDFSSAYGLKPVFLRYFNAAGADPEGRLGENHDPETHLIPLAIQAALGRRGPVTVFGADYPTPDGTCVRDYVHVMDLADAHLKAMEHLLNGGAPSAFNLGSGTGYSVREVVAMVEKVGGKSVPVIEGPRRAGDPPALVASSARALETLGWKPRYAELEAIVKTAYEWHKKQVGSF